MPSRVRLRETTTPYQELIGWKYSKAHEGCCDPKIAIDLKKFDFG